MRRIARLGAAGVLVAVTTLGLAAGPPASAIAQPADPVRVDITQLSPTAATGHDTLRLSGVVTNTGASPLTGLTGQLLIGAQPVSSLAGLALQLGAEQLAVGSGDLVPVAAAKGRFPTSLAPHAQAVFRVSVALADVPALSAAANGGSPALGVFPLEVDLDEPADGLTLGRGDTVLTYSYYQPTARLRVVMLWPVQDTPATTAVTGQLTGSALARDIAPTGRLGGLLAAGAAAPAGTALTWVLDPDLLQGVATLAAPGGYQLTGSRKTQRPDPDAASFLSTLASATAGADLVALPYADPDLVALQRAGLATDVNRSRALGRGLVMSLLHQTPQTDVVWPVGGRVNQPTLTLLRADGVHTVVLSDQQLPAENTAAPSTTSAAATLPTGAGPVQGLAVDGGLGALVSPGGRNATNPRLAEQLVLAYTALVVDQLPNGASRDIVIAPPRNWDPAPGFAADLLQGLAQAGWLRSITLSQAQHDPDGEHAPLLPYPASARADELAPAALSGPPDSVAALQQQLASVAAMFGSAAPLQPLSQALLAAESVAWRPGGDPSGGASLRAQVGATLTGILARVRVAASQRVTLTSSDAALPVTIDNLTGHAVTVLLRVLSTDPTQLTGRGPLLERVASGQKAEVSLPVRTQRSGTFTIQLDISTPDGRPLGPDGAPLTITVNSHNFGDITIVITVGALAVLVGSLLVRAVRRLRRPAGPAPLVPTR